MKAQTLLLIVLALTIGLVSTQDYTDRLGAPLYDATQGAMSRNIYATTIYYKNPATPLSTASINRTMVAGLFDSTQTISYAAALNEIATPSVGTAPELILQVENITINAARTQFTLNLRFNRNQVLGFSTYGQLGYSVIFIGSNFNKQSSPLSAALARTSRLVDVTDTATQDSAQFDFVGVTNEPSPFDFIPTASNCGVSKDGTADRIEVLGCSKPIFISFLSGFVVSATAAPFAEMSSYNFNAGSPWNSVTSPADTDIVSGLQTTSTSPLYVYKSGPNDQSVGPKIYFSWGTTNTIKQIQLSMVFVGLRSFSAAYPSGISDSFIVAAAGHGYQTPITAATLSPSIDGLKTPAAALNIKNYNGNTGSTMGHLFCGFVQLNSGVNSALNLLASSSNLQISTTTTNDAAACLIFATRSPCVSSEVMIPSASFTSVVASPVTVTDKFLGNIAFPGPLNVPGYSLEIGGYATLTTATKVTITKEYVLPAGRTQLVFYSQFSAGSAFPSNTVSYVLTLAGVVYPEKFVTNAITDPAQKIIIHVPSGTTKVTATFVITINPMAAPTSFIVRQSLYYFDKVISSLQSCDTKCPEVTGATTGVTIGANPPACLVCQTNLFQVYKNGVCQCKTGYYYDASQVCQTCTDAICATCTAPTGGATTTTCNTCVPDATLLVSGVCVCNDGFYKNPTTKACQPCPYGCRKCTSLNVCTECQISVNSATLVTRYDAPSCQCIDGYYSVTSSFICEACDSLCLTCSSSATSCDSCDPTKNLYKVGNTCKCVDGFYLLGKQCAPCSATCKTCDVSSINCLDCPELRILSGTNNPSFKTCECDTNKGFVQIDYGCVDSSCTDLDSNCRTCILDLTGLRIRQCLTCSGNRQVVQGKCVCAAGFYQDGTTCKACGAGCQTCTSASVCTKCATGSIPNGDGTCTCKAGFLLVSFSNSLYCQPCSSNCATCIGSSNVCNTCKPGFQKSGTKCVCPSKTFLSAEGLQCYPCIDKCDICSDADSCLSCSTGFKYQAGQGCLLNCDGATYDDNSGSCQNCPTGCSSCYQYGICRSCSDGFYMYAGSCRTSCPDGSFPYDNSQYKQCLACPKECETCSSLTQCNKCNSQYVYLAGKCTSDCEKGTYFADGSCRKCDTSCAQCSGSATFCTKCQNKYLYNNQCVSTCPVAVVNGQCTATCQDGSFLNGNVCQKCDPKCLTCKGSATTCTSCTTGFSSGGDCVSVCPNNQYASVGFCAPCDISCQTCQQNPFNCIQCANGYIRSGVNCIKSCGQGLYYDSTSQTCLACNSGCQTCLSANQCTQCLDPTFSPIGGVCQKACPTGANLIKGVCVCSIGVLHQSTCVSNCPDGLYATSDKTCALCNSPCFRCSGSSTNCLSCVSGYDFDSATKTCKMTSSCPYGAVSSSGTCIKICVQSYFFNGGCIFSCPNGYQPNNYNGCVQSVSPTYCQIPLFQSGNTCVNNCPTSFWPNSLTRTCERCMANCRQCLSDTVCITCANGYSLNYDQTACVQASTCQSTQVIYKQKCYSTCPYGTYQSGRYCIRSCRSSLYFYEDFCYSSCPTDFKSDDACYKTCPSGIDCRSHN